MQIPKLLDVVALMGDAFDIGLVGGAVGTIVEELVDCKVFEVEFADETGETLVMAPIKVENLLVLRHGKDILFSTNKSDLPGVEKEVGSSMVLGSSHINSVFANLPSAEFDKLILKSQGFSLFGNLSVTV